MCLSVVGIANSPQMGGKRTASPPGGHMGPPLRRDTHTVRKRMLRRCHKMHLFTQLWAQK